MSKKTKVLMCIVMAGMFLPGLVHAAMDDVMVWNSVRSEDQLNDQLQAGGMPVAAIDDVIIWDGAYTQGQIEGLMQNEAAQPSAIDDVIIWDSIRSVAQIEDTLQNGYSSAAGMHLWWSFDDPCDPCLAYDATGNGYTGVVSGNVSPISTETPASADGRAAAGFSTADSMIVVNPAFGPQTPYYVDRTYEMWIRNPNPNGGVFFSITQTEAGGGDFDVKRMWVNADGSITMADRGSKTGIILPTSVPLTWENNVWYQITVVFDYIGTDDHDIRVYRGKQGETQVELLLDYQSSSFAATAHYLAVGAHPGGYYSTSVGKGGFMAAPGPRLWWDFSDADNLGTDITGNGHTGNVYGNVSSLETDTPSATAGLAAGGFVTPDSMIVGNPEFGPQAPYYFDRTYQMAIRNPGKSSSVFFSITSTEMGGGDSDVKRMWVNDDGSITIADRGSLTWIDLYTSSPLTWEANAWYQIFLVFDYNTSNDYHDISVYRGKQGESQVEELFSYQSSSFGNPHYLAVGAHPAGYYSTSVGKGGYLGQMPMMWWDFSTFNYPGNEDPNTVLDVSGNGYDGTISGSVYQLTTDTPSAGYSENGQAASGFDGPTSLIKVVHDPAGNDNYWSRTYTMWLRNPAMDLPLDNMAVFFSLTSETGGGGDADFKRVWVDKSGRLVAADRGYYTGIHVYQTEPLVWSPDQWYMIAYVFEYTASDRHDIRVYRGRQGDSQMELLLDYESSSSVTNPQWLKIGAHPVGYPTFASTVGQQGYLGPDDYGTVLDCADALGRGHRAKADLSADCYVEMVDLAIVANQWLQCSDPTGQDCQALPGFEIAPTIAQGSATVDGDLSDWADADWIDADQAYFPIPGGPLPPDVSNARWAARWDDTTNLIYLAATLEDTNQRFTSGYANWDAQDHLEVYIDAGNSENMVMGDYTYAQHFNMGYNGSGGNWLIIGDESTLPTGVPAASAATVDGTTISYEIALQPFTEFYPTDPNNSVQRDLAPGQIMGLDVVFHTWYGVGPQNGMVCENTMVGKFNDAGQFRKTALAPLTCGLWGYLQADIDGDCYVNIRDFAVMASQWLDCIDPVNPACDRPWETQ